MKNRLFKNLDYQLLLVMALILVFSLVILSSATATVNEDRYFYVRKQVTWIGVGLLFMGVFAAFDYAKLNRYSTFIYAGNLGALLLVLAAGNTANGSQSWIDLGPFRLQPSEFAKVFVIITLAGLLVRRREKLKKLKDLLPCFLHVGIPMLLILKQPDLGTSLVFIGILFGMLFVAGVPGKLLSGIVLSAGAVILIALVAHNTWGLTLPLKDYQIDRLLVFINPYNDGFNGRGAGYHIIQSQVAIGSGYLWGNGLYQGSQVQLNFLPEHHTDFIFSVVGEEMGFFFALALLLLYFFLLYRCLIAAVKAKDMFGTLLVSGVVSMLLFHVLVNVGMTMGVMPITGIPLPFFSYGGSNMLANMMALGLVMSVNLRRRRLLF